MDYLRDPAAIYRRSFAIVAAEADLSALPEDLRPVAIRIAHACGMPEVAAALRYDPTIGRAAREALANGAAIVADTRMVAEGVIRGPLPADNPVHCILDAPDLAARAKQAGTTRSAAGMEAWAPRLTGALVVIGNAPTALFRLLELLDEGLAPPAVILGFPVGFVGAAESKDALATPPHRAPYLTLPGRRGGSAMAAAAVNGLSAGAEA